MDILKLLPVESLLAIICSLVATIFALTLKITDLKRTLKHAEEESSSARSEVKSLNERFNKELSDIKEFQVREIDELAKKYAHNKETSVQISEKTISVLCEIAAHEEHMKNYHPKTFFMLSETAMAKALNLSLQEIKFHLEQLSSARYIERHPGGSYGGLRSQGRAFLHGKDLLPKSDSTI